MTKFVLSRSRRGCCIVCNLCRALCRHTRMLKRSASSPIAPVGVDNMIMLDNLTEETVLNNLEVRHKQMQAYVCTSWHLSIATSLISQ